MAQEAFRNPSWQGAIREMFEGAKFDDKLFKDSRNFIRRLPDGELRRLITMFEYLWAANKEDPRKSSALSILWMNYLSGPARNRGFTINFKK